MARSLEPDNKINSSKISVLDPSQFQLKDHDFHHGLPAKTFDYELWKVAYGPRDQKSSKFFFLSLVFHFMLGLAALSASLQVMENQAPELIEFELSPSADSLPAMTAPEAELPEAPSLAAPEPPAPMEPVSAPPAPKAIAEKPAPIVKPAPAPKVMAQMAPIKTSPAPSPVVVRDNLEDIEAPDLDESATQVAPVLPEDLGDTDLQENFDQVDRAHQQRAKAIAESLNQESQSALHETDQVAAEALADAEAEAEKMTAYSAAQKARDAQAIAAAEASERAAAAKAAKAQAEAYQGQGTWAGVPTDVRSLDQVRQRPGNPVPQYDANERLQRHQGQVTFVAFVNEEGIPTQFQMLSSTGHRNLDAKTLKAFKQWRFYPGQAGWVEFPFMWDLKGEAQEMPALLRRKK